MNKYYGVCILCAEIFYQLKIEYHWAGVNPERSRQIIELFFSSTKEGTNDLSSFFLWNRPIWDALLLFHQLEVFSADNKFYPPKLLRCIPNQLGQLFYLYYFPYLAFRATGDIFSGHPEHDLLNSFLNFFQQLCHGLNEFSDYWNEFLFFNIGQENKTWI